MDGLVTQYANEAALLMKTNGIPPVEAVSAVYKETRGGSSFDDEFKRAVLRELGRRGGRKAAIAKKASALRRQNLLRQMINEARIIAFQRRDHLLPDP